MRLVPALLACVVVAATATADGLDVDLGRYAVAAAGGATGEIVGRIFNERPKPSIPDPPMVAAPVVAVPRSEALLRRLEELRGGARDSATAYRDAASRMRAAREAYELALWQAGAADLVRATVSDANGRFGFTDLPEGQWILIARYEDYQETRTRQQPDRERKQFAVGPRLVGYRSHRLWVREIDIRPRERVELELTDRNVWFSGVIEDRVRDTPGR